MKTLKQKLKTEFANFLAENPNEEIDFILNRYRFWSYVTFDEVIQLSRFFKIDYDYSSFTNLFNNE